MVRTRRPERLSSRLTVRSWVLTTKTRPVRSSTAVVPGPNPTTVVSTTGVSDNLDARTPPPAVASSKQATITRSLGTRHPSRSAGRSHRGRWQYCTYSSYSMHPWGDCGWWGLVQDQRLEFEWPPGTAGIPAGPRVAARTHAPLQTMPSEIALDQTAARLLHDDLAREQQHPRAPVQDPADQDVRARAHAPQRQAPLCDHLRPRR